jgi:hypothetical protein
MLVISVGQSNCTLGPSQNPEILAFENFVVLLKEKTSLFLLFFILSIFLLLLCWGYVWHLPKFLPYLS